MRVLAAAVAWACLVSALPCMVPVASADENLFGYVRGSETLPAGELELYSRTTVRDGKGTGSYQALDEEIEFEFGVTDRFMMSTSVSLLAVDTNGLSIDGDLPGGEQTGLKFSGLELTGKYSILRPAIDDLGLSVRASLERKWLDSLSGEDMDETELEVMLIAQQDLMDGQLVWAANAGVVAGYEVKAPLASPPLGFSWDTEPEVELGLKLGAGISYRFVPRWFVGVETLYESKYETEEGLAG